jgi:hypothetical protein
LISLRTTNGFLTERSHSREEQIGIAYSVG